VPDLVRLKQLLDESLTAYNEENSQMDLVLFDDAMQHVCRINRILGTAGVAEDQAGS
jgi:dynein heavy chain